jgi:hypothetical protein
MLFSTGAELGAVGVQLSEIEHEPDDEKRRLRSTNVSCTAREKHEPYHSCNENTHKVIKLERCRKNRLAVGLLCLQTLFVLNERICTMSIARSALSIAT